MEKGQSRAIDCVSRALVSIGTTEGFYRVIRRTLCHCSTKSANRTLLHS